MSEKREVECPACGSQFSSELILEACQGCPLAKSCGKGKCPYCGREFAPELNVLEEGR